MKRTIRFISAILTLAALMCLCACGSGVSPEDLTLKADSHFASEAPDLEGTWTCPIDCTELMNKIIAAGMSVEDISVDDARVIIPLTLTFDKEKCTLFCDMDTMAKSIEYYIQNFCAWLTDYVYETTLAPAGISRETADQLFIAEYGMTLREYVDAVMAASADVNSIMESVDMPEPIEYSYKLLGSRLVLSSVSGGGLYRIDFSDDDTFILVGLSEELSEYMEPLAGMIQSDYSFHKDWAYTYGSAI